MALAAGAIAGCGSSSTPSTSTVSPVKTSTVKTINSLAHPHHTRAKHARPVKHVLKHHPGHVIHITPKPAPKPAVINAGPTLKTLSGTGDAAIGNVTEKTTVVLEWSTTAAPIQIFNRHGFFLVNSSSPTGKVRLTAGNYTNLRVATKGRWTIELRASA